MDDSDDGNHLCLTYLQWFNGEMDKSTEEHLVKMRWSL